MRFEKMSRHNISEFLNNRNIVIIMITQTLSTFLAWLWWPYKSLFILARAVFILLLLRPNEPVYNGVSKDTILGV